MEKERKERITKLAWKTFRAPDFLMENEFNEIKFYEFGKDLASKEFWTGEWADLSGSDDDVAYLLKQFWYANFEELKAKVEYAREHQYD